MLRFKHNIATKLQVITSTPAVQQPALYSVIIYTNKFINNFSNILTFKSTQNITIINIKINSTQKNIITYLKIGG